MINSAVSGTKKCQDAEAKGVTVVDENWVRNRIAGGGSSSKKVKATPAAVVAPPAKKAKVEMKSGGDGLSGLVFAITGLHHQVSFFDLFQELSLSNELNSKNSL